MTLCTTIMACEPRRAFAEQLARKCAALRPMVFWSGGPLGLAAASANFRAMIRHVAAVGPEWWLMLEDDQKVFPAFFDVLDRLPSIAERYGVAMLFLSNREVVSYAREIRTDGFVLRLLRRPVPGSHGLLIRGDLVAPIAASAAHRAIFDADRIIWDAVRCTGQGAVQIVEPVLMEHLGARSTLGHELENCRSDRAMLPR